jgi:hypothetical protein
MYPGVNGVKGIKINNIEHKFSQYTDDTCLFMADDTSLHVALTDFENYTNCSGLKVNKEKSEAIWIGSSPTFCHKPLI